MGFATKYCDLNVSQYGSKPGRLCHSAILNKVLTYDILRATKKNGVCAESDAVANYNHIILALMSRNGQVTWQNVA